MKIGILTFHCPHNYGAVLQAYALQQYLLELGYEVEIIDYRPKYLLDASNLKISWKVFISKKPLKCLKKLFNSIFNYLPARYRRYVMFNKFINNKLLLSERVLNNEIPNKYDVYIIGSDQVWNPKITGGFDDVYFSQFSFAKKNKKYIAYAASMGINRLTDIEREYCRLKLYNFDYIGVREFSLKELLQPIYSNKIEHVLDPTLLVNHEVWDKLAKNIKYKRKYVLIYTGLAKIDSIIEIARKIAKPQGLDIVVLTGQVLENNITSYQAASPEQFVGAFKHASFVITTTFHGTVFSVIFNKNFYSIKLNEESDSRVISLLSILNLQKRIIDVDTESLSDEVINWTLVNELLEDYREKSKLFLKTAIE